MTRIAFILLGITFLLAVRFRSDVRRFIFLFFLFVFLANPQIQKTAHRKVPLNILLDVSGSMAEKDETPSRLEKAKEVVKENLGFLEKNFFFELFRFFG